MSWKNTHAQRQWLFKEQSWTSLLTVVGTLIRSVKIRQHFLAHSSVVSLSFSFMLHTLRLPLWSYSCCSFWSLRTLSVFCSCLLRLLCYLNIFFCHRGILLLRLPISFSASKHLPTSLSNLSMTWEVSLSMSLLGCWILFLVARVWNCTWVPFPIPSLVFLLSPLLFLSCHFFAAGPFSCPWKL